MNQRITICTEKNFKKAMWKSIKMAPMPIMHHILYTVHSLRIKAYYKITDDYL